MRDNEEKTWEGICPSCKSTILIPEVSLNKSGECPFCNNVVLLESEDFNKYLHEEELRKRGEQHFKEMEEVRQKEKEKVEKTPATFTENGLFMSSWVLICISVILGIAFALKDISVGSTVNLGLMHDREIGFLVACSLFVSGFLLMIVSGLDCIIHNQKIIINK